jgi:hypothetical protein
LSQKQTWRRSNGMSALHPKADIVGRQFDVRFVPKADSCTAAKRTLFDHLVGDGEQARGYRKAECFGGLEIDDQFEFCRLNDG